MRFEMIIRWPPEAKKYAAIQNNESVLDTNVSKWYDMEINQMRKGEMFLDLLLINRFRLLNGGSSCF